MEKQVEFLREVLNLCYKYGCFIVPECGYSDDYLSVSEDVEDRRYLLELLKFLSDDLPF